MMRHTWRVYLQYFTDEGDYTGEWVEITDDVEFDKLGAIQEDLDNTEYDIGVYRSNNFSLVLRNDHGHYSDVGSPNTTFVYKRSGVQVKVTWEATEFEPICGFCFANEAYLSEEMTLFRGIINDEATDLDVHTQTVNFKVLGRESVFQKVVVPFADLSAGDTVEEILLACLDQTEITDLMTVDAANINVSVNQATDSVAFLENKTVQEALSSLLLVGNAVVYLDREDNLIIAPRDASASVEKTFYGQAATAGSENIQALGKIKSGIARTFNFFTWTSTALYSEDASSRAKYGTRKKDLSNDGYTDTGKRTTILNALRTEFGQPKMELELSTFFDYETEALLPLDRVALDYPPAYLDTGLELPICGDAICGDPESATLPRALWDFTITTDTNFKILGRSIDTKTGLVKFKLREI